MKTSRPRPTVALLIPCYNEEVTIADVVEDFREQLHGIEIYVFDNNSTDRTVERARRSGATIFSERRQGKGYVVQSMFRHVDADIYVMVDGDGTYPPADVHKLIAPVLRNEADMVVGSRLHDQSQSQFKFLNRWGNKLILFVLNSIFAARLTDVLSGYRAFNREFVKAIPLFGGGFEIEAELTIKAVARGFRIVEVPINLTHRPQGSFSKINLVRDGVIIVNTMLALFRDYKPLTFFGALGLALIAAGFIPGLLVGVRLTDAGSIYQLPLAVLAVGLVLSGMLLITVGLILHTIARRAQEFEHQLQVFIEGTSAQKRKADVPQAEDCNAER